MLDVLVALVLLALALTGACVTLVQAMRGSHNALLANRAADLAADLTEDLRGADSAARAAETLGAWRTEVASKLPVAEKDFLSLQPAPPPAPGEPASLVPHYQLRLRGKASDSESRELILPIAAAFSTLP